MNKFLYLHIPKTGGVTFRSIIENASPAEKILHIKDPQSFSSFKSPELEAFSFIHGHLNINQLTEVTSHKIITTLRTPIERCISTYFFWKSLNPNDAIWSPKSVAAITASQNLTLEEIIASSENSTKMHFNNFQTRLLSGASNQESTINDNHLRKAIDNLQKIDFYGINSRLEESIDLLCFKYGLFRPATIQKLNASTHYIQINQDTKSMLEELNDLDLQLLEWAEKEFDQQRI